MIKNYLKIALRNISVRKIYTGINVLGLAFGVCACITIYLVTSYELSFEKFHPDADRIYRIVGDIKRSNGEATFLNCPVIDPAAIPASIPGFEATTGMHLYGGRVTIPEGSQPPKKFDNKIVNSYQSAAIITWPQYFDVFPYTWLAGNAKSLNDPFRVVLSESRAIKYFGDIPIQQMIGKTVIYDDSLRVIVSGIVKDWNHNTDFGYTDFISISTATHSFLKAQIPTEDWNSLRPHGAYAFVKISKDVTAAQINQRLSAFIKQHRNEKITGPGTTLTLYLQPLTDIHFTKEFHRGDDGDDFRKPYLPTLYALMCTALFILVIAVVNFVNLSTAQSIQRAKEIGVRKVLGGNRRNIMLQFLTETFVLTLISVFFAVLLVRPAILLFKDYIPEGVSFQLLDLSTLAFLVTLTLVTAVLAGFYPARIMASYLPVQSLKGMSFHKGIDKINMRKALIIFQFTISLIFIIAALVVGRQIHFMNKSDKGFNSDAVLVINHWRDKNGELKLFANSLRYMPGIRAVIIQDHAPMGFAQGEEPFSSIASDPSPQTVFVESADENYIPFYQMKLVAGKNLAHTDSLRDLVINETYSRLLGFKKASMAIGHYLYHNGKPYPVVGVVADFHQGSFHEAIHPCVIANMPERQVSVAIKLQTGIKDPLQVKSIIAAMEAQWKKIYPEEPFNCNFLNESITWLYGQEQNTAWLINCAMCITIFISCMGLFGLAMFSTQKRTKEIGIRKVLGAGVFDITALLSTDFIKLVLIALLIATPVAWYTMHQWLQDFVYRTTLTWWIFASAGLASVCIALLTVSSQAFKAALINPVISLRSE